MTNLRLIETSHYSKDAQARYDALVGIDASKQQLLDELSLCLCPDRMEKWRKTHHPKGLPVLQSLAVSSPLILLSGDVGCGKTALAQSIGSPLSREIDRKVIVMETPSDIRGRGHVGELSARLTEAFDQARAKAKQPGYCGLLIIDEGDDLATARDQMHAHHEDRAGVNVLIKEIDAIAREKTALAVLLITNRSNALDPAVTRRASLHLRFERPKATQRRAVMERLLAGTRHTKEDIEELVKATAPRRGRPFSFSDLTQRLARSAIRHAYHDHREFGASVILEALQDIEPSPLVEPRHEEEAGNDD